MPRIGLFSLIVWQVIQYNQALLNFRQKKAALIGGLIQRCSLFLG